MISTPFILAPSNGYASYSPQVNLAWGAIEGINMYEVCMGNSPSFSVSTTMRVRDSKVSVFAAVGVWYVRVRGLGEGASNWSPTVCFTRAASLPPVLITPLPEAVVSSLIKFTWRISHGATKYRLGLASGASGPWTIHETRFLSLEKQFPLGDVYWKVEAFDGSKWSGVSEIRVCHREVSPAPSIFSPKDGVLLSVAKVEFNWGGLEGFLHYTLEVSDSSNFDTAATTTLLNLKDTSIVQSLSQGNWFWRVRGWDGMGFGEWSSVGTFTRTKPEVVRL